MRADIRRAFEYLAAGMNVQPPPQTIPEITALLRDLTDRYGDVEPRQPVTGVVVEPVDAGGVPAEWIVPDAPLTDRALVYLHGGGWVAGSLYSHRPMAAAIAKAAKIPVLLVDYRLAPENPYPAGLKDSIAAFLWAAHNSPAGPAKISRLFLGGDSCGGNLAAVTCLSLIERHERTPDKLVLISALLDATQNPDRPDRELDPVANNASLAAAPGLYAIGAVEPHDPHVSPIYASETILASFPPTLVQASGAEFLHWDSRTFATRLATSGARVTLSSWPGLPHVWHLFSNFLPEAAAATEEIAIFLR
jgi:epsilon-lactone hydrolase